jgi:hypothetical protein
MKEFRNPKSEGRKRSGIRRPKTERRPVSDFGFRISAFFRISDFGLRISLTLLTLVLQSSWLLAATNAVSDEEIPPLRPPRDEIPPSLVEQYGSWLIAGGILAVAVAGAIIWFLTRPKPAVAVPPAVQARSALEPLGHQTEDGALLSHVSYIMRRYVAAAFGLPRAELTTAEFCTALTGLESVGPDLSKEICRFLIECDRRKFAPSSTAPPVLPPGAVARAYQLIDLAETRHTQLSQSLEKRS